MFLDKQLMFSDNQDHTGMDGAAVASENVIDLGANRGDGEPLEVWCQVTEAFAGGTSLTFALQDCDEEAGTYVTRRTTAAILTADLIAGKKVHLGSVPPDNQQYLRLLYTAVGTFTDGAISAGIVLDQQLNG